MKRIVLWIGFIFGAGLVPMLMAPTGGYPSLPTFSGANIGNATASGFTAVARGQLDISAASQPSVFFNDNSQAANSRAAGLTYTGAQLQYQTCPDTGSGCAFSLIPRQLVAVNGGSNRTSNASLSCDAQLTITTTIASKQFLVHGWAQWTQNGSTSNGLLANLAASGTGASVGSVTLQANSLVSVFSIAAAATGGLANGNTQNLSYTMNSAGGQGTLEWDGLVVTGATGGTFCLSWAQATSNATSTTINNGGMILTQVN